MGVRRGGVWCGMGWRDGASDESGGRGAPPSPHMGRYGWLRDTNRQAVWIRITGNLLRVARDTNRQADCVGPTVGVAPACEQEGDV